MAYFLFCDDNCKHEGMTKEQILAAIAQASGGGGGGGGILTDTETNKNYVLYVSGGMLKMKEYGGELPGGGTGGGGVDIDDAFITKVKEGNAGGYITFWVGTQAQYNALVKKDPNCYYHITNSTRDVDIDAALYESYTLANAANELAAKAQNTSSNAVDTANRAVSAANNALSVANSKTVGAVREQEYSDVFTQQSGLKSYEYNGIDAKFYVVEAGINGNRHSVTIPYRAIRAHNGTYKVIIGYDFETIKATIDDAAKTVTFVLETQNANDRLLHIAGYY